VHTYPEALQLIKSGLLYSVWILATDQSKATHIQPAKRSLAFFIWVNLLNQQVASSAAKNKKNYASGVG
jgi:hypothetical protein